MNKIVFVGQAADCSGAGLAHLHLLDWLCRRDALRAEVVLLHGGDLSEAFASVAPTRVVRHARRASDAPPGLVTMARDAWHRAGLRRLLCSDDVDLVLCDGIASATALASLLPLACPLVVRATESAASLERLGPAALRALRGTVEILAVSSASAAAIRALDPGLGGRTRIVPMGLPLGPIAASAPAGATVREALGIPVDAVVVGGAGRVGWQAGADLFVQLAARVQARPGRSDVHFLWYGPGSMDYDEVRHDMRLLGMDHQIHFAGPTHRPGDFHDAFDLFAAVSREGVFPMAALEAAAREVPVLGFEVGDGATELVEDDAGCVVPWLDVEALADAVVELAADPARREELGANAAAKVRSRHDLDAVAPVIRRRLFAHLDHARADSSGRRSREVGPAPSIAPVCDAGPRPTWSVMIPTCDASEGLLETTLRSVLQQDPGAEHMQIAVVDDGTKNDATPALIESLAPGRIEYYGETERRGRAAATNAALTWSRGHWVHLLRQHDVVLPGLYVAHGADVVDRADVGAFVCGCDPIDAMGHASAARPGEVDPDWLVRIVSSPHFTLSGALVRRSVYEEIGGARPELGASPAALDWELAVRIAAFAPIYVEPRALAAWRPLDIGGGGDEGLADRRRAMALALAGIDAEELPRLRRAARQGLARLALVSFGRGYRAWVRP